MQKGQEKKDTQNQNHGPTDVSHITALLQTYFIVKKHAYNVLQEKKNLAMKIVQNEKTKCFRYHISVYLNYKLIL